MLAMLACRCCDTISQDGIEIYLELLLHCIAYLSADEWSVVRLVEHILAVHKVSEVLPSGRSFEKLQTQILGNQINGTTKDIKYESKIQYSSKCNIYEIQYVSRKLSSSSSVVVSTNGKSQSETVLPQFNFTLI